MNNKKTKISMCEEVGQWQLLQIYNAYRVVLIVYFAFLYEWQQGLTTERYLVLGTHINLINLSVYCVMIVIFIIQAAKRQIKFRHIIFLSVCVDLLCLNVSMICLNSIENSTGVAMNVATAALAIMLPGIAALCFAAVETLILFVFSFYQLVHFDIDTSFINGVHGAGIFVTAITSLILGRLIQKNHQIATLRQHRIVELENINKFIIHKLQSILLLVDEHDKVIFANRAAKRHYGLQTKTLPCDLKTISTELYDTYLPIKQGNYLGRNVIHYLEKSDLLANFMIYRDEFSSAGVILIDNPKKVLQQAHQLKLASLGRFTASIAHELRNPLGAISHASQLLCEEGSDLNTQQLRLIEIIDNNCNRMNNLIKNILQLSRQQPSQPSVVDLCTLIENIKKHFQQHQQLSIHSSINQSTSHVLFDPHQLFQLFVIFIENAICYGKDESGHTDMYFEVSRSDEMTLSMYIYDTGVGIPEDKRDRIFEPFYTTAREGTGLGLFLAKEICAANQTLVDLSDARPGKGACFEMQLMLYPT